MPERESMAGRESARHLDRAPIDKEALDVLAGTRTRDKTRAAVRIEDLTGILKLLPKLQSAQVTAAPTMAQFNALQKDVAHLHTQLRIVSDALTRRLGP